MKQMDELIRRRGSTYTCILQRNPAIAIAFLDDGPARASAGRKMTIHVYDDIDGTFVFRNGRTACADVCRYIASGYRHCYGACGCPRCTAAMSSPPAGHSE